MKNQNVKTKELREAAARHHEQARPKAKALTGEAYNEHAIVDRFEGEQGSEETLNTVQNEYDTEWRRASNLEAPPSRPGFVQRWIRVSLKEMADAPNASKKFREGWRPRRAIDLPEGYSPATIRHAQLGDVIAVGDLVLCEMPTRMWLQRQRYYRERTVKQTQAVSRISRRDDKGNVPIDFIEERKTSTKRGKAAIPAQDGDITL